MAPLHSTQDCSFHNDLLNAIVSTLTPNKRITLIRQVLISESDMRKSAEFNTCNLTFLSTSSVKPCVSLPRKKGAQVVSQKP